MTFFCNRGRENVRFLKPSDFTVATDEDGLRYVTKRDNLTKNRRENDDEAVGGRMYEIKDLNNVNEKCPVQTFEKYMCQS